MTVRQAREKLLQHLGLEVLPNPDRIERLGESFFTFLEWLHRHSSRHMEQRFGCVGASHPEFPDDIDAATELTAEQEAEFHTRLRSM
ncbi:MAG: hypothetical protein ACREGR_02795 [Minisyncoccia bacterium]